MLPTTFSPPRGTTLRTPRKLGTSVPGKGATWATLPHALVCAIRGGPPCCAVPRYMATCR